MTPGTQIILSGTLTFGVPLLLAVKDLIATRRASGGGWEPEPPKPTPPAPPRGGNQIHTRTLPQCLIDAATVSTGQPSQTRVLEHV